MMSWEHGSLFLGVLRGRRERNPHQVGRLDGSASGADYSPCSAPDLLDTELSLFMQQLRVQGAAAELAAG